jgi:glycosyltransferase involved in cell wall biosynthesis
MNIVFLIHLFPVKGMASSGAGNYVSNIARTMTENGHKVFVVTEADENSIIEWNGIEVHYIRLPRLLKNKKKLNVIDKCALNLLRSIFYNKEVEKINNCVKLDIVQSINTYAIPLFRKRTIPYVVRISAFMPLYIGANMQNFEFEKWLNCNQIDMKLEIEACKKVDYLIAPSEYIKKIIEAKTNKMVHVIEGPVYPEDSKIKEEDIFFIKKKYILTYGILAYRKSIHLIAKIVDKILDEDANMLYILAGKDKELIVDGKKIMASQFVYSNIKKNKERFFYLGEVEERSRMFAIIENAYVCVLPTRTDNLPNSVSEAMMLGKIVISSDKTSVEQLIVDGDNGFLVEVDNVEALYQKIKYVLHLSPQEKKQIENRAKERVKVLDPQCVYKKMIDVYENTIANFKAKKNNLFI